MNATTTSETTGYARGTADRPQTTRSTVLVTGASGLVGSALLERLAARGQRALRAVRSRPAGESELYWSPREGELELARFESRDADDAGAVVHLAGENIADGRWTKAKMQAIRESRVAGTRLVAERLARSSRKPSVLVSASAIGFYGDRGDEVLTEGSPAGQGFLPDVCVEWERATEPAREAGIRVVNLRIGVVLAKEGGALARMLTPFKLGAGGKLGSGEQYMSWIHLEDLVSVLCRALDDESLVGPVNATAPKPATNLELTKALGAALHRPTIAPMPAIAARLAFGKMADDLLLASARVVPQALQRAGFRFEHPDVAEALRDLVGAKR